MGSPGSGKTTTGRILGGVLGKSVVDVDNDYFESQWGMPVAQKVNYLPVLIQNVNERKLPKKVITITKNVFLLPVVRNGR